MGLPSWCLCNSRQNSPPHKQDGPWSYLVLVCTFFQSWLLIGTARAYGVYLPVLMKEFDAGRDKIALVSSLSGGLSFLMTVIVTWLSSFIGYRTLFGIGHVTLIIAFAVSSFVHKVELLYFTYSSFRAIGMAFVLSLHVLLLLKYFKKHRSLAQGINSSGGALGIMTVPIITQYMLDSVGWRHAFRIQAAAVLISSLLCLVFSPNVENERHGGQATTERSEKAGTVNKGAVNHCVVVEESDGCITSAPDHQNLTDDIVKKSDNIQNQSIKGKDGNDLKDEHQESQQITEFEDQIVENNNTEKTSKKDGKDLKDEHQESQKNTGKDESKDEIPNEKHNIEESTAEGQTLENSNTENQSEDRKSSGLKSMFDLSVWRVPLFTASVISISIASFSLFSVSVHLVKFSEEVGLSPTSASSLYIFMGLASLIARIVGGKLCDISCIKPSMVNMAADLIGAIATFLLTVSTTYVHFGICMFMYGFFDGMFRTTTIVLYTTTVERSKSASAFGQANSLVGPFFAAGPAITGLLADEFGDYTKAFYLNGCVFVAAAAIHLTPILLRCRQTSNSFTLAQHVEMRVVQDECNNYNDKEVGIQESRTNPSFMQD